mmetsp:Transcript_26952/g.62608  ORF Transcript_26952/g.62608 Transcript_26952/m.62608 type:complete len:315 (+) Transcript_26952:1120-2064(+)
MQQPYTILLYYCYTTIEDPQSFRETHHHYCIAKGLRGRIIIAEEGINGTVSGLTSACKQYMNDLKADAKFAHTHFKVATHHRHAFHKLHVRVKPEIVHAGLTHICPHQKAGPYITAQDIASICQDDDVILLDVRSNYEHALGKFKKAVTLDIDHFRAFPGQMDKLSPFKNKKIVTYCTGGVKCEKASAYLLENGFTNVYQLYGGIIQYGIETDGKDFEGTCYVFDNRLSTPINKTQPTVIGHCYVCCATCDRMVNCANPICNKHVPICKSCAVTLSGACSKACQKHPKKRYYDGTGYYTTHLNGYNPYRGSRRT